MKAFIPQLWVEALDRSIIQSLSHAEAVALSLHYEQKERTQKLKRRNTLARRRRRAAMKREKRRLA